MRASLTENPDLFYCIRGVVAPSCGIVLEYTAKIYPQEGFNFGQTQSNYVLPPPAILQEFGINENDLIKGVINEVILPEQIQEDFLSLHTLIRGPAAVGSPMTIGLQRLYSNYTTIEDVVASEAAVDAILATNYLATKLEDRGVTLFGTYTQTLCTVDFVAGVTTLNDSIPVTGDINQCKDPEFLEVVTTLSFLDARTWMYDTFEEFGVFQANTEFGLDYIIEKTLDPICVNLIDNEGNTALNCGFFFTSWGGNLNNPQIINKTAFPHRNSIFDFNIITLRQDPLLPNSDEWIKEVFTTINNNNLTT